MEMVLPKENYVEQGYWKNENIHTFLHRSVNKYPEKIAAVDPFFQLNYKEMNEQIRKLAGALRSVGVQKGDVVSFQLPNWIEAVIIHQATAMIGAISNPILPIYREKEIAYILKQSKTKVLFIPYSFRKFNYLEMIRTIRQSISGLTTVVMIDKYNDQPMLNVSNREVSYASFLRQGFVNEEIAVIKESDPLLLLYTSGTTANPKGVLHTHNTLLHEITSVINLYHLDQDDVIFMPSPVTHITGVICGLELPFVIQGKVVFQDIWEPTKAVQYLIREKCTWSLASTPFLRGIIQALHSSDKKKLNLKAFPCGGADVPPELIKKAAETLGCCVARMYGSSEIPSVSTCGYDDSLEKAAYTDGKILEGIQAKIVNENKEELPVGHVGELAVKGPELFLGYIQSELNNDAFLDDGYFLTGDLAVLDQDGYLQIKGRKKDIIIRGGENISVKEVEDLLYQHPKITSVAIVAMPDEEMGEKACAYIVPDGNQIFTFEEMIAFLTEQGIAKQKFPERLELIDQMPMTASGKIQKFKLREDIMKKIKQNKVEQ